jgi:uncharacterized flavoprotein (TIGR03862 family)
MAAETLARGGAAVTVYDGMSSAGRKFLLAGRGGLNLTHSEEFSAFLARYGEAAPHLRAAIGAFPPAVLRAWAEELGQKTFVGSSGRVFPEAMKTSPLLRAWLRRLGELGVMFKLRHRWEGWEDGKLMFATPEGKAAISADAAVLALGGASWPQLGSDGGWVRILEAAGVAVAPLRPANCGFMAGWSDVFADRFAGQPLKRIALTCGARTIRGEAIVTRAGLEGGGIYALSAPLRDAIEATGEALLEIDLRPDLSREVLEAALAAPREKQSFSNFLRKSAKLSPAAIGLLNEAAARAAERPSAMAPAALAILIKSLPVRLTGMSPIARAISTAGGVPFVELDSHFMLRRLPGVFAAGEMLDWEAPTGGYLLQASFSTGAAAGRGVLRWLARHP